MLGMSAKEETIVKWKTFSILGHCYNEFKTGNIMQKCNLNQVFANLSKEEEIFPLTTQEIVEAQKADNKLKQCFRCNTVLDKGLEIRLVVVIYLVCKDGRMIISKPLQQRAVLWLHLYLQHPGHTQLEEIMNATMYYKSMGT
jgi:hypothetical protein